MRKMILFTILLLTFCFSAFSQDYEYGKSSELKGVKKIFVNTGMNLKDHQRIVEEIEKAKLDIEIVDSIEKCDVVLLFNGATEEVTTSALTNQIGGVAITNLNTERLATGRGIVMMPRGNKMRLLLSVENSQQSKLEKKPVVKFAKEFVKQYKIANGLSDK